MKMVIGYHYLHEWIGTLIITLVDEPLTWETVRVGQAEVSFNFEVVSDMF